MSRRRTLTWILVVAFVVMPLVEIYVLIQVGQVIGAWWTIALLIADSVLGGWLVKREGGRAWDALRESLHSGRLPHRELADGALILIAGTLMLTPGFVTDLVGVLLLLPFTRPFARHLLGAVIAKRLVAAGPAGPAGHRGHGGGFPRRAGWDDGVRRDVGRGDVVKGEVVDD